MENLNPKVNGSKYFSLKSGSEGYCGKGDNPDLTIKGSSCDPEAVELVPKVPDVEAAVLERWGIVYAREEEKEEEKVAVEDEEEVGVVVELDRFCLETVCEVSEVSEVMFSLSSSLIALATPLKILSTLSLS